MHFEGKCRKARAQQAMSAGASGSASDAASHEPGSSSKKARSKTDRSKGKRTPRGRKTSTVAPVVSVSEAPASLDHGDIDGPSLPTVEVDAPPAAEPSESALGSKR